MMDIHIWLDKKIAERHIKVIPGICCDVSDQDAAQFVGEALALKVAAISEGYSETDLIEACGGDVARFTMDRHKGLSFGHEAKTTKN